MSPPPPTRTEPGKPPAGQDLALHLSQASERGMHEMIPLSMLFSVVAAGAVVMVLHTRVPLPALLTWFTVLCVASAVRLSHAWLHLRGRLPASLGTLHLYRTLTALDGLAWGALGWALTPASNLEVAIVTIGILISVACIGTFMQHIDLTSAALFISPILLPNIPLAWSRQDDLGLFCAVAVAGLWVVLLLEARRSNARLQELLRLRFEHEKVSQAQAEALRQAAQLSETKSRFLATMSHEMRTPLHGILGMVRLLRQQESQAHVQRQLDLIQGSGDHLVHVINDILDYSRMEAGSLPLHDQPFDLHALLTEVADTSRVGAHDKGLSLLTDLALPPHVHVLGDPIRIRQVLHNLLGNAIKFTATGQVSLRVRRDLGTGHTAIEVHDSGIGIPPAEQARIFDAFHQAEGTYQRRFGGTGLGLTISRDLCRAMGGELQCRSQAGQGSVFSFSLPLPAAPAALSPAPHTAQHPPSTVPPGAPTPTVPANAPRPGVDDSLSARVLLVEDNPVNAIVAEAELRNLGLKVTLVRNGRQAVDWLAQHGAELILMDCEMPEMDGFEATRQIRQLELQQGRSPVRIVALTANGLEAHAHRCREAGMDDYLAKPFRPDELARTVSRHLPHTVCIH